MNTMWSAAKRFVEIHGLKTMPPGCHVRGMDDRPKSSPFGNYDRTRWSSASQKKPMRSALNDLPGIPQSYNTAMVAEEIQEYLKKLRPNERKGDISWQAWAVAASLVSSTKKGKKPNMNPKRPRHTAMSVNIAQDEVARLAEIADQNWKDTFAPLAKKTYDAELAIEKEIEKANDLKAKKRRSAKAPSVPESAPAEAGDVTASAATNAPATKGESDQDDKKPPAVTAAEKALEIAKQALFDATKVFVGAFKRGTKAAGVLCFGRFLAKDQDPWQDDPAVQISDAMGVNVMRVTPDSWSCLDELSDKHGQDDSQQSNNLGTRYITSDCMYTYAAINVEMLLKGYEGNAALAKVVVESLLWAIIRTIPRGRQNTHASYSMPSMVFVTTHSNEQVNLMSAFEKPVEPTEDLPLSAVAAGCLDRRWGFLRTQLKQDEVSKADTFVHCDEASASTLEHLASSRHTSLETMIREIVGSVFVESIPGALEAGHRNGNGSSVSVKTTSIGGVE